jgi:hypothetical protein
MQTTNLNLQTTSFTAKLYERAEIDSGVLLSLPKNESEKLPSRGMVMIKGMLNEVPFQTAVEPDGNGSHWFKVPEEILTAIGAGVGDTVTLSIEPIKEWPEPKVPTDLQKVLEGDVAALSVWNDITPMARWDWIRWIGATKVAETRKKRVESIPSRMANGKRRPCCFDRSQCTLTDAH